MPCRLDVVGGAVGGGGADGGVADGWFGWRLLVLAAVPPQPRLRRPIVPV